MEPKIERTFDRLVLVKQKYGTRTLLSDAYIKLKDGTRIGVPLTSVSHTTPFGVENIDTVHLDMYGIHVDEEIV